MPTKEKQAFLKKEEMNIRQSWVEAVPTIIFRQIAQKIRKVLSQKEYTEQEITALIQKKSWLKTETYWSLLRMIKQETLQSYQKLQSYQTRKDIIMPLTILDKIFVFR